MRFTPTKTLKDSNVVAFEALNSTTTLDWRLSKAAFTPGLDTILADIVQPTYPGYADVGGTLGGFFHVFDTLASAYLVYNAPLALPPVFRATSDATPPESIFGFGLYVAGPGTIWCSALFPTPVPIGFTDDGLLLGIELFRIAADFMG